MADQNKIEFKVQVTDEGLAPLANQLTEVDKKVDGLGQSADTAGKLLDTLGAEAKDAGSQSEALGKSAKDAADGMDAATKAVKAKSAAVTSALDLERTEVELARRVLDLQRTQAEGLLKVAKAKGDEAAATSAGNKLRQIETGQLELTARAKRAEAAAVQAAADARREQLSIAGPLTQAQQRELTAAENTAKAFRVEAAAADEAARQVRGLGNSLDSTAAKGPPLNAALTQVGQAVAGLFALNKAKDFALDTIAVADAYGQMAERIGFATPVAEEYNLVQERILATANLTYRRLEEQQELYIRTADALRGMSYSTSEALDIQDSFSYLLTTNAASVERGKNAIDAYTKSIQSGRIEVDSWQSIMAATPTIVNAVAVATGKTADEIRRLGITGKLSIEDLNEGLRKTVEQNKELAAGMGATVNDAVTRLNNTWSTYVGEANRANQSTQSIVNTIDLLSENLDLVISLSIKAGEVMAAVWGLKALSALKAYTAQLAVAAAETSALMAGTASAAAKAGAAINTAGQLALAGWSGWEIGSFLKDEFEVVERAGIAAAAGLTRAAAQYQAAWEIVKATFSDDTIEAAHERLAAKIAQIDDTYSDMFANVGKGQDKLASDTKKVDQATSDAERSAVKYKEAMERATLAQDALRIARSADAQVAISGLNTQLELARQSERMAQLLGKEKDVRDAKILQMQIEIQITQAKVNLARAEAEGSIAVANATLAELKAKGELTAVKEAELNASIKIAQAKIAEAEASGKSVEVLNKQLELFKSATAGLSNFRGGLDDATRGQRNFASATRDANSALEEQAALAVAAKYGSPLGDDKYSAPKGGSVTGNSREERLAGQGASNETLRFDLLAKLQSGTLSEGDLGNLKTVVAALKANEKMFASLPPGLTSLEGVADDRKWENARVSFEQAIATLQGKAGVTSTGAAAVGGNTTHNVNVNIGGRSRSFNAASPQDAQSAADLFKEIETASRRS